MAIALEPLLAIDDLEVVAGRDGSATPVLRGVSIEAYPGEIVGIVGETGSGKTMTALATIGLLPSPPMRVVGGRIWFQGRDLLALPSAAMRNVRGRSIAMIFQDPVSHLNPVFTIGEQLDAVIAHHHPSLRPAERRTEAVRLLEQVQIHDAAARLRDYPHQFSGGMAQRVMIAMALASGPALLIADEPTAALDVTVQRHLLRLLRQLARAREMTTLFISHNLGAVSQLCDRVVVMYAGQVVEHGSATEVLGAPTHPYTRALLAAVPRLAVDPAPPAVLPGAVPSLGNLPSGCAFAPRCPEAIGICRQAAPPVVALGDRRTARCVRVRDHVLEAAS